MKWFWIFCICFFVMAESDAKVKKQKKRKKLRVVNVDFDDELEIKGKLIGPSIFSLFQKKDLNYGKLIKPRENFLPEMRRTFDDIN